MLFRSVSQSRYRYILEPNDIDIEFLYGGRDSGKSHFTAQKLIIDCLQLPYFRCIMIEKTYNNELQEQKKELEAIRLTEVKKAAQKGLKSKFERDLELQNDIEYYQDVLSGKIKTTFILGQKVSATENLPIQLVLLVQNTINDLRKELAKRLGEYEATTIRAVIVTGKGG